MEMRASAPVHSPTKAGSSFLMKVANSFPEASMKTSCSSSR